VLAAAAFAAYANSFAVPLVFDDEHSIRDNATIRQIWPLGRVLAPPDASGVRGRPILNLSFAVSYRLSALEPWGHHAVNLAIHGLAALVLFGLVRRTLLVESLRPDLGAASYFLALAVALLWTLHPLQTESVTYLVQRGESLMGLFYLLTLYCAVRAIGTGSNRGWTAAAIAACALGMGTKEVMASAPIMVLVYDRLLLSGAFSRAVKRNRGLYLGLAATWIVLGWLFAITPHASSIGMKFGDLTPLDYLRTQSSVILHYLRLSLWPSDLSFYYLWPVSRDWPDYGPAMGIVAAIAGGSFMAWRRHPAVCVAGAWFFLILAPTSSIVPIRTEIAAEHRMYLPLASVIALVVTCGFSCWRRLEIGAGIGRIVGNTLLGVVVLAAAITLGVLTRQRNEDYRDPAALWSGCIRRDPQNLVAMVNLGVTLQQRGDLDAAIGWYERAIERMPALGSRIYPADPSDVHNNLGFCLYRKGRTTEGMARCREALRIRPDHAGAMTNIGIALAEQGRLEEAVAQYRRALELRPDQVEARYNLGLALARQGRLAEATENFAAAARARPWFGDAHHNLGVALARMGRLEEAAEEYAQALREHGDAVAARLGLADVLGRLGRTVEAEAQYRAVLQARPETPAVQNNLAWLLATSRDVRARDGGEAVRLALEACASTRWENAQYIDTLAAAHAETGNFAAAIAMGEKAVSVAVVNKEAELAAAIRGRVEQYRRGRAHREGSNS
jgi:tetratricopeptide (TPR) repeat protein